MDIHEIAEGLIGHFDPDDLSEKQSKLLSFIAEGGTPSGATHIYSDPANARKTFRSLKGRAGELAAIDPPEIYRQTATIEPILRSVGSVTQRYILSACQDESIPHEAFLGNLEAYAGWLGNCEIMIAGFTYNKSVFEEGSSRASGKKDSPLYYHDRLKPYLSNSQIQLCDGLLFCGEMNTLPTAVRPLSGFETYTGQNWGIFPHPKVQLEAIATAKMERPKHLMTTGCVTLPNYVQKKAGIKASFHHIIGALLVEVEPDGSFFCRHIQADDDGSFYDLDRLAAGGAVTTGHNIEALNPGDIHHEKLDPDVAMSIFGYDVEQRKTVSNDNLVDWLRPAHIFMHDLSDFSARNHHNIKDPHFLFQTHKTKTANVEHELRGCAAFLSETRRDFCKTVVVQSNHDNALLRWLKSVDWREDMENAQFYLRTQLACLNAIETGERTAIFEKVLRDFSADNLGGIDFVGEDDSYLIADDIECSMHGHLGANGSRGNLKQFSKFGRKSNTGHSHSAGIHDGAYVAGVCAHLDMTYNKGPSSWSHSNILTYQNGKRAIITEMNKKWHAA
jgi:hypothetical protein